jgi:hypothetical protein
MRDDSGVAIILLVSLTSRALVRSRLNKAKQTTKIATWSGGDNHERNDKSKRYDHDPARGGTVATSPAPMGLIARRKIVAVPAFVNRTAYNLSVLLLDELYHRPISSNVNTLS